MKQKYNIIKLAILVVFFAVAVILTTQNSSSQSGGFKAGDTIPGFVLRSPSGSLADVRAAGTYDRQAQQWTVILTRALVTNNPDDVQFDQLASGKTYLCSCAVLDNAIGKKETMEPQDSTPYEVGIEGTGADIVAVRVEKAPASAGDFTGPIYFTKGGEKAGIRVPPIGLKAAYDDKNIYLLATWPDDDENVSKEQWVFDGATWTRTKSDVNDEDRFAIWFDVNAEEFATKGCAAMCHETRMQTKNPDGLADLWHWKAARTNPLGFADDQRAKPLRGDDSGVGTTIKNESGGLPAFMAENDPGANAKFLIRVPEGAKRGVPLQP
ncbi:MAG: hypothetical protein HY314_10380 [Acidobacteria bacterium]|nr:hypothetical protein [Acidobacteriota bacterium]